jgi:small subunit ribosomal protein S6
MNCYETIYIMHPDLSEEAEQACRDAVAAIIDKAEGRIYQAENWGKKRLAYDIRKQSKGIYQLIRFVASAEAIAEIERMFRLDESYLKYLILRLNDDPATAEAKTEAEATEETAAASSGNDD